MKYKSQSQKDFNKIIKEIRIDPQKGLRLFYEKYGDLMQTTALSVCRSPSKADEVVNGVLPSDGSVEILPHPLLSCREETELIIPEGIKEIEAAAIYNCDNLTAIYLPKSIKILEYHWWDTCDKLTDIYYAGTEEEWNALYVPDVADQGITMHFLGETEAV